MRVMAGLLLVAMGGPLGAQVYGPPDGPAPRVPTIDSRAPQPTTWREQAAVRRHIGDAQRAGQIDRRTARGLKRNAVATEALTERLGVGGISASEQRELDTRVAVERAQVDAARVRGK